MSKHAQNDYPIHDLLRTRWSPRAFTDQAVANADLLSLFEAARWSPSGGNSQPWAFVVTQRDTEDHTKLLSTLMERNALWARHAPVLALAAALPNPRTGTLNKYSYYDVGQAVAHLSVQATALDLYVHQMAGFDAARARQLLQIPENCEPMIALAIGLLGDPDKLPDDLREREKAPRTRKPVAEFVFRGQWGVAW